MSTIIHSVTLVDDGQLVEDGWIALDGGTVAARGTGATWRERHAAETVDGAGGVLTPGFIDIHGHGGGGASFDDGADAIATARALHRAHGTTRAVVSLVTAPVSDLARRAAMVADLAAGDPTILGSHLEGPFLDAGHKGAHTEALLRAPDAESLDRLMEAGRGSIRQITLAPELPGGLAAVGRLVESGVRVAVGHTGATEEQARAAFDAGATLLTHAFNAMPGIHHRAPGPVVAALHDSRVTLEIIADGVHVHPDVVALAFTAAPDRVALITDAMAAAGATDGRYELGGLAVTVTDGTARLDSNGAIAGSTLTQDVALRNAVAAGVALPAAVAALTTVPAHALGYGDRFGALRSGAPGDAVLLDSDLRVRAVWVDGVRV